MTEWDVTITYDAPCPPEDILARLLGGPIASAGRSPWSDRLTLGVHLVERPGVRGAAVIARLAVEIAEQAIARASWDGATSYRPSPIAVEALCADEVERRTVEPARPQYYSATETARLLDVSAAAVRQQAESLDGQKVGEAGWIFPRPVIDAAAARRRVLREREAGS